MSGVFRQRFTLPRPSARRWLPSKLGQIAQILVPIQDISAGAWLPSVGTDLFATIDEAVANDTDYDYTESASVMEVKLTSGSDPFVSTDHKVRYRLKGNGTADAIIRLKQGGVVIATWTETNVPATETDYEHTLSGAEADAITNYADLRLNVEV